MGKKKTTRKTLPEKAQTAEPSHAWPTTSITQTEPKNPAVQPSQAGTSQTPTPIPSVPLDAVMKFLQSLSPGLDLEATLKSMATTSQITPIPQPPPQKKDPSPAGTSSKQTTRSDESTASEFETSESTSHTSEKTEEIPTKTTSTQTPETEKSTVQTTGTLTKTKAIGNEGRSEELVEEDTALKAKNEEVMGERITESKIMVDPEELQAEEEAMEIAGDGEMELGNQEGSEGREESSGGSDGASDGASCLESDADTEVVSDGNQDHRQDEGEVVNREKKRKEKECKAVMRKSQVPYMRKIEELSRECALMRRSRRIAGRFGQEGTGQEEVKAEGAPMEISSDEEKEEEVPLRRRTRSAPIEPVALAKAEDVPTPQEEENPEKSRHVKANEENKPSEIEEKDAEERSADEADEEPANKEEDVETRQTDREGEPLKNRLRSSRATGPVADPAKGPKDSPSKAQANASILPKLEKPREKEIDEATYQQERKRKGKMPAQLVEKKARKVNTTVVIKEPVQVPFGHPVSEGEEASELEETSSKEKITYDKFSVDRDKGLFKEMQKFEDSKLQTTFNQKDSKTKEVKSGKMIHLPSLSEVASRGTFFAYLDQIGFNWLLDMTDVPIVLAREFYTSFRFSITTDLDETSMRFRVFGMELEMSLTE